MNQVKRELRFNRFYYNTIQNKRHKSAHDLQTTLIEHLSNELFYEIFDYLDGCEIYQAFSNLNQRFQHFLESLAFLIKIKFSSYGTSKKDRLNVCQQLKFLNRHQIYSINFWSIFYIDQFFSNLTIDSSFVRLESITLSNISTHVLIPLLNQLPHLPRLFSLTIQPNHYHDLTDIYRIIFTLRKLTYFKFTVHHVDILLSLPIATNQQFSPIEYLILNQSCTFEQLSAIVSYTPQLRHLVVSYEYKFSPNIEHISPITLPNVTKLSIRLYPLIFEEHELFMERIQSKLKVLHVTACAEDSSCLDDDQWEAFIVKYVPQLEKFSLRYYEVLFDEEYGPPRNYGRFFQFTSPFWIDRQWIFESVIDHEHMMHSVRPYTKRWYDYTQDGIIDYTESARLILNDVPYKDSYDLLIERIYYVSSIADIYHLEIPYDKIFNGLLIQIINALVDLTSLKIHSLSLNRPRNLNLQETDILCWGVERSDITHVYLEKMLKIQDIHFLMKLCPNMEYFKVNNLNNINVESFLRSILEKINSGVCTYLCCLCFRIPTADDVLIKNLENMINSDELLAEFTIKRIADIIYLEWKVDDSMQSFVSF